MIEIFQNIYHYIYILLSSVESSFWTPYTCIAFQQKDIQNPFKHFRWNSFACPVNDFKLLTVWAKIHHLDTWIGFEYTCIQISSNNVFCHHNKHLMGYFEFLYGSGIICLPLNIPEKLNWQHLFEKPEEAETHRLYLS